MAPPLACTHEIYATRIAKGCGRAGRQKRRERALNSFNFAASARIIAPDCSELANHKGSRGRNYDKKIGYSVMETPGQTFCELVELSCFDFQEDKWNGSERMRNEGCSNRGCSDEAR